MLLEVSDSTIPPPRFLPLAGPLNFRDLGGYLTESGRQVRWRTLFRADGLQYVTPADVDTLRPYALRTVIDLRSRGEIEARGQFPIESYPLALHHLAVIDQTWDLEDSALRELDDIEFIRSRYAIMLDEGAQQFADAFRHLAAPDALPAVFHCAAGKDRTGLLAALLLGSVGVGHDDIVSDYALTALVTRQLFERVAARSPEMAERLRHAPKALFSADPAAMRATLADVDRIHGSISNYLRHIGVEPNTITRLQETLLMPT
jgi:protein-tyrosine phosphatase